MASQVPPPAFPSRQHRSCCFPNPTPNTTGGQEAGQAATTDRLAPPTDMSRTAGRNGLKEGLTRHGSKGIAELSRVVHLGQMPTEWVLEAAGRVSSV